MGTKMTNILVCDDDKEIVDAIEIYLNQEGYQIYKARWYVKNPFGYADGHTL